MNITVGPDHPSAVNLITAGVLLLFLTGLDTASRNNAVLKRHSISTKPVNQQPAISIKAGSLHYNSMTLFSESNLVHATMEQVKEAIAERRAGEWMRA